MKRAARSIRFKSKLLRPAAAKTAGWTFLVLPRNASAKLPSRGMATVAGTLNGIAFRATLAPDGRKSHWLKVNPTLREAAGARVGDAVVLEIAVLQEQAAPRLPADLRKAFASAPQARAAWSDITPVSRRDWIQWITSASRPETRARRIDNTCAMLAGGKRRVCCFDRSGFYSKGLSAPKAASR